MHKKSVKAFSAKLTIGLVSGYSVTGIDKKDIISSIQNFQDELIRTKGVYLSASVTECSIVMSGQVEPHLTLGFINYPKFPLSEKVLKAEIEALAKTLMSEFHQNRIVIEYPDQTIMLEQTAEIDPRIKKG